MSFLKLKLSLFLAIFFIFAVPAHAAVAPSSFADLVEDLSPAVVNISTTQTVKGAPLGQFNYEFQFPEGSPFGDLFKEFFGDRLSPEGQIPVPNPNQQNQQSQPAERKSNSLGSGFVIEESGYIVTNNHVIAEAEEIDVIFHDNTTLPAEIIGRDEKTDLALLKVKPSKPLKAVHFGDSDTMRVGDWVIAIGNPFGLGGTVTAGIISARARDIHAGPYDDFLQTDASINRGNSGGPMFNTKGEVIGINTAIFSPTGGSIGIGFAIPAALAKPVIDQLKAGGHVKRGWLGVRIQAVEPEIAEGLGLKEPKGALISEVTLGGPAEKAGFEIGDVILSFDGQDITEMRRLPRVVAETPIGKKVDVEIWRKGSPLRKAVVVGELKEGIVATSETPTPSSGKENAATDQVNILGMNVASITSTLRAQYDLDEKAEGLLILSVDRNSVAAEKGLKPGDVIAEIAQSKITNPQEAQKAIEEAQKSGQKSILFLVNRNQDMRFVALRLAS